MNSLRLIPVSAWGSVLLEAVAAIYWPVFRRFEGYFTFFLTIGTSRLVHFSVAVIHFLFLLFAILDELTPLWTI